jgi:hypothetical protein
MPGFLGGVRVVQKQTHVQHNPDQHLGLSHHAATHPQKLNTWHPSSRINMFFSALSVANDMQREAELMVAKKKAMANRSMRRSSVSDDGYSEESTTSSITSGTVPSRKPVARGDPKVPRTIKKNSMLHPETVKTTSSTTSTPVPAREPVALVDPKGPWMIKKNSMLRAEAVKTIEDEIVSAKNMFSRTRERCMDAAKVTIMRFENGSEQGAKMSLKKLSARAHELATLESRCYELVTYRDLIESHTCSPDKFAVFLEKTLEEKDKSSCSDALKSTLPFLEADLEGPLRNGTLMQLFIEVDLSDIVLDVERKPTA